MAGEHVGQGAADGDAELAIDTGEVTLDRSRRDVQRLRDVTVRAPVRGELGDPPLARGQRLGAAQRIAPRTAAGRVELGLRRSASTTAPQRFASSKPSRAVRGPRTADRDAAARSRVRSAPLRARGGPAKRRPRPRPRATTRDRRPAGAFPATVESARLRRALPTGDTPPSSAPSSVSASARRPRP